VLFLRDPNSFCNFLLNEVQKRGASVRYPVKALRTVSSSTDGSLEGLIISCTKKVQPDTPSSSDESTIEISLPCTHILISAGPWSRSVFSTLFPATGYNLPIMSQAGHSIVLRSALYPTPSSSSSSQNTGRADVCHAVFAHLNGLRWYPEIFSRANGDIWLGGLNSYSIPLPEVATEVKELPDDLKEIMKVAEDIVTGSKFVDISQSTDRSDSNLAASQSVSDKVTIIKTGLCHRPVTPAGIPILDRIPDAELAGLRTRRGGDGGVFIAAGHGPWGISQSLGTGKVMAQMMLGEKTSADVSYLGLQ